MALERQMPPLIGDLCRQFGHPIVKAGDCDRSLGIVKIGDDAGEHVNGVLRGATEHAGMKIAVGPTNDDFLEHKPAQHCRDRRRPAVPHARVADEDEICRKLGLIRGEKAWQRVRAGFLPRLRAKS